MQFTTVSMVVQIGGKGNLKVREATCDWRVFKFNPQTSWEVWMGDREQDTGLTGQHTI